MNIFKLLSVAALSLFASQAVAETALTITGRYASEAQVVIQYSIDDLKALDQTGYDTINDFVEVPTRFSGPLLRDVLAPLTLSQDATLEMTALNDYQFDMPLTDAINYDVIVALEQNGPPCRSAKTCRSGSFIPCPIIQNCKHQFITAG